MYIFYLLTLSTGQYVRAGEIRKQIASVLHGIRNVHGHLKSQDKNGSLQKVAQLRRSIKFMESCIAELKKMETRVQQRTIGEKQALASYEQWKTRQIDQMSAS